MTNTHSRHFLDAVGLTLSLCIRAIDDDRSGIYQPVTSEHNEDWSATIEESQVPGHDGHINLKATFTRSPDRAKSSCVFALKFSSQTWSRENYVILPGSVYAGNRFPAKAMSYPPLLTDPQNCPMDTPVITDVPRLEFDLSDGMIQQLAGDMTTPGLGVYFPAQKKGLWIFCPSLSDLGHYMIDIRERQADSHVDLIVATPNYRDGQQYRGCGGWTATNDVPAQIEPGTSVEMRLQVIVFDAYEKSTLFGVFRDARGAMLDKPTRNHDLPFSQAWTLLENKHNDENWYDGGEFYAQVVRSANNEWPWRSGWCGGLISSWPLLLLGDQTSKVRSTQSLNTILTKGIAPSGLFYSVGNSDGTQWQGNCYPYHGAERLHLIRRTGDSLYYAVKHVQWLASHGNDIPAHWSTALRRVADALVQLWTNNKQFGQYVDQNTGKIIIGGSSAGGIIPAALTKCAEYFNENNYLDVAIDAANFYYRNAIQEGLTTGGPGEILQCPDSESCFAILESLVTLGETTGDSAWVEKINVAANLSLTWCMDYDFQFPRESLFGRLGIHSAGSVWANVQNKHSSPGICTHSGLSLLKAFRMTGHNAYIEMLQNIAHNITQYISRPDKPINNLPSGWMNERVNTSDWENAVGEIFYGSCWPEVSCMLTCAEIPGVYINTAERLIYAFDHVNASVDFDGGFLSIHNPTRYPVTTTVYCDNCPLPTLAPVQDGAFINAPPVHLSSGEKTRIPLEN